MIKSYWIKYSKMLEQKLLTSLCLVHLRIAFLTLAFVHLVFTAVVTLNIDVTLDEDPKVRAYHHTRWKLITCWFNLITLAYLPARIYCEWKIYRGDENSLVQKLNQCTDVVFTAILVPVILFSDVVFWIIYNTDPDVLAPPRIFEVYLPYWAQHSLHTVSFFMVLFDLMLTPRKIPKDLKPRIALLLTFSLAYNLMVAYYYSRGQMVYSVFEKMSWMHLSFALLMSIIIVQILFSFQWVIISFIWHGKIVKKVL